MIKKLLLSAITMCVLTVAYAQSTPDSLIRIADAASGDSLKVKWYNDAVWELVYNDHEKALQTAKKALVVAERSQNPYSLSDCYNTLGACYYIGSDFEQSIAWHEKALAIRLKLNDKKGLVSSYNNIGSSKKELGNYKEEADFYFKALKIAVEIKDSAAQASILNNIADAFLRQKQYDASEKYNLQALEIRRQRKDTKGEISCYINLAVTMYQEKNYERSASYYRQAEQLLGLVKDNYLEAKFHANYAALLKDTGHPEDAVLHIRKSIALNEKIGNNNSNLVNFINLASVYEDLKQYRAARSEYQNALEIALAIGSMQWRRQSYLGIATTSYALGSYKEAYENHVRYLSIKDSLQNEETGRLMAEAAQKYEVSQKEAEIRILKQDEQIHALQLKDQQLVLEKRKNLLVLSSCVILLLVLAGYFYFSRQRLRARQAKEEAIRDTEENERMRMAKDIHDDLGSGLSKIKFISELLAAKAKQVPELMPSIDAVSETSVRLIDNMRDLIWALNPENTSLDSLVARIREYSSDYLGEASIHLDTDIPDEWPQMQITKEAHRNLFFIVKEALQNMIKHASASEVLVRMALENDELVIQLKDNGKGMMPSETKGNGLRNMQQRASVVKGHLDVQSEPGYGVNIQIRVPLAAITRNTTIVV